MLVTPTSVKLIPLNGVFFLLIFNSSYLHIGIGKYLGVCQDFSASTRGRRAPYCNRGAYSLPTAYSRLLVTCSTSRDYKPGEARRWRDQLSGGEMGGGL